jgi:hypothetical protein
MLQAGREHEICKTPKRYQSIAGTELNVVAVNAGLTGLTKKRTGKKLPQEGGQTSWGLLRVRTANKEIPSTLKACHVIKGHRTNDGQMLRTPSRQRLVD